MKTLVIDQGNSFAKLGIFEEEILISQMRIPNDQLEDEMSHLPGEVSLQGLGIERGIVCSTLKDAKPLCLALEKRFSIKCLELSAQIDLPIQIHYSTPGTLGPDRIAAAVGAHLLSSASNTIIIDAGTAITIDLLKEDHYCGGVIIPGIGMRLKAMHHFTGKLPLLEKENRPFNNPGQSTDECVCMGAVQGARLEVAAWTQYWGFNLDDVLIYLTGGDAFYFDKIAKSGIFVDANLVLKGLNKILHYNISKDKC